MFERQLHLAVLRLRIAERLVGRAVRRRADVTVMTKVGLLKTPAGISTAVRHGGRGVGVSGLRAATSAATWITSSSSDRPWPTTVMSLVGPQILSPSMLIVATVASSGYTGWEA